MRRELTDFDVEYLKKVDVRELHASLRWYRTADPTYAEAIAKEIIRRYAESQAAPHTEGKNGDEA